MSSIPPLSELHENATNLISQKAAHDQALADHTAKKTEAHALSNELDNAETKINQLIGSSKRFIREAYSNSTAPATSCADVLEFVHKIRDAVKEKIVSAATNYAKRITASTATCNQEERNNLTSKAALILEAKSATVDIITYHTLSITETKHKINAVINQMKGINEYLILHEASTIDHGTTHLITTQSVIPASSTTPSTTESSLLALSTESSTTQSTGTNTALFISQLFVFNTTATSGLTSTLNTQTNTQTSTATETSISKK